MTEEVISIKKNVVIVSNKSDEIGEEIIQRLNRSIILLEGRGGYTKDPTPVIYCIVNSNEVVKLKEIVDRIDSSAFLIINDIVKVKGSTFKFANK